MRLDGKVAIVTGAASGIGEAVARRLAADGAIVAVVDRNADGAAAVAGSLPSAIALGVDVADEAQVDAAVAEVVATFGGLDVLANIAGLDDPVAKAVVAERRAANQPLDITRELTTEAWRRILTVNLDGTFFFVRAALGAMVPRGGGSIVNMASLAGVVGAAGMPHYSAAKAAVIGFTQSVAREVAPQGVRVNAIAPGGVDTPMLGRTSATLGTPSSPMGRLARADEIASVVAFLASDDASYVTGAVLNVDGAIRAR